MKKILSLAVTALVLCLPLTALAQGMMYPVTTAVPSTQADQTAQDESAGKAFFDKLQAKQIDCKSLSDDDFDKLGDYFMGQMMGASHAAMNARMEQQLGAAGEQQMHVAMGKRLSGCDPNAAYPAAGVNMMYRTGGLYTSYGWHHSPAMVLSCILVILLIVLVVKWAVRRNRQFGGGVGSAMNILKERYAKGEITKQEFEEKKKDIIF